MNLTPDEESKVLSACQKATSFWGNQSQFISLLEEMGELQILIAKAANGKQERVADFQGKVIDEMADVYFMLWQLEQVFGNSDQVRKRLLYKCARTEERIKGSS